MLACKCTLNHIMVNILYSACKEIGKIVILIVKNMFKELYFKSHLQMTVYTCFSV